MKRLFALAGLLLALAACRDDRQADAHPDWSYGAVVYEMNVRQLTHEGTLRAAASRLAFLRDLGVDVVWLMPVHPIGVEGRKGTLGSYYAIRDYRAINPEFGTMADFERFLDRAHKLGMRVILDYVANHTSPDHAWVTEMPAEWYVRDSTGVPVVQYDWTDIAKLNYATPAVREAMFDVLKFWTDKGVDGFRCDMAMLVPVEFWNTTVRRLKRTKPDLFMLAEAEETDLFDEGAFDACYAWEMHHLLCDVAQQRVRVTACATTSTPDRGPLPPPGHAARLHLEPRRRTPGAARSSRAWAPPARRWPSSRSSCRAVCR